MRYLQVVAQDRSAQGVGDFLLFRFYEDDRLLREATAAELRRLKVLGKTYLKCAWFNIGEARSDTCGFSRRTLQAMAQRKRCGCIFMTVRRLPIRLRRLIRITTAGWK